jgi:hypothetical protein
VALCTAKTRADLLCHSECLQECSSGASQHLEDAEAVGSRGVAHVDAAVEAPRSQQGVIQC